MIQFLKMVFSILNLYLILRKEDSKAIVFISFFLFLLHLVTGDFLGVFLNGVLTCMFFQKHYKLER